MRRAKVELAAMVSTGYVGQAARMGQGTLHAAGDHIGWRSLPIWAYPSSSRDSPPRSSHASNTLRTQPSLVRLPASSPTSVNATTLKQLQSLPPSPARRCFQFSRSPPRVRAEHRRNAVQQQPHSPPGQHYWLSISTS